MSTAESNYSEGSTVDAPKSDLVREREPTESPIDYTRNDVVVWGLSILMALVYIMAGVPKLGTIEFMHTRFTEVWGYPAWFEYLIGALEFVGGIFLLIPATAFYAASGLAVIMLGAMYTHLALGEAAFVVIPATCLLVLLYIAYQRRPGAN